MVLYKIRDQDSDQILKDKLRKILDNIDGRLTNNESVRTVIERISVTTEDGGSSLVPHADMHENDGSDEMNVVGLSGLLADAQTPLDHDHETNQLDHGDSMVAASLLDDDHTIYVLLVGRSGGQEVYGGTGASDNLTLKSTSNATKGFIIIVDSVKIQTIKSGATQAAAGAAVNEVWKTASHATLPDNVLMIGV